MDAIATLKQEGVTVMGMETTSRSQSYVRICYPEPSALVAALPSFHEFYSCQDVRLVRIIRTHPFLDGLKRIGFGQRAYWNQHAGLQTSLEPFVIRNSASPR